MLCDSKQAEPEFNFVFAAPANIGLGRNWLPRTQA